MNDIEKRIRMAEIWEKGSMNIYDVSALIVTYNPEWEKLKMTIRSFLLQRGIKLQIVITDDGSEQDYFDEIVRLFQDYNFDDYRLVKNTLNLGTVKNIEKGLKECTGKYLKTLSPGDYLIGAEVLRDWCEYMHKNQLAMSGSNYICYYLDETGQEIASVQKYHPKLADLRGDMRKRDYLLSNDTFVGAATLCDTEIFRRYLNIICGSVKYAEDFAYRIMVYCDEKIGYYNVETILYEVGTGISTSGNYKWKKLLDHDWQATDQIILGLPTNNVKFKKDFLKILPLYGKDDLSKWERIRLFCSIKGMFLLKVRKTFCSRFTSGILPRSWIEQLKAR